MKKLYSNKAVILSLVLSGLLLFFFAILAPICLSVYYGFTDYSGMGAINYVGLENYRQLMTDKIFWLAMRNSLFLAIGFICIQHPLALITAAVLDKLSGKAEGFFRCVYFIPNVISVAVIAYLWKFIYNPDFGLLNNIIKAFGGKGGINWFSQKNAIWSVLVVLIWHGFGWGMLIYYTGIKNVDPVLYEAAAIDGADQKTTFLRITLPLMKPVIQVNVTMAVITALKQMETVYLLTNGGPGNSTQFAANYLYQQALRQGAREYLLKPVRAADTLSCLNRLADEEFGGEEAKAESAEEASNRFVKAAEEYIAEHYAEDLSLAEVAEKAGISGGYLSTLFSQHLGCKFVDYLNQVRIERACTYLEQNYFKTYEVAYRVGFKDEKYFSKVFKKLKGVSPKEYRCGKGKS